MKTEITKKIQKLEIEIIKEIDRIAKKYNINYFLIAGSLIGCIRNGGFIPWDDDLDISMPRKDYEKFIEVCKYELNDRFILDSRENNIYYYRLAAKVRIKNTKYIQDDLINYKGNQGIWVDILPLDDAKNKNNFDLKIQSAVKSLIEVTIEKKVGVDISNKSIWKKIVVFIFSIFSIKKLNNLQKKIMTKNNNKNYEYFVNLSSRYGYKKYIYKKSDWLPTKNKKFENINLPVPNNYDLILKGVYGNYMKIPPKEKQYIHNPILIQFEDGTVLKGEKI